VSFKKIAKKELQLNPVDLFAADWPLLTAGNEEKGYNTMTIAWGHIGAIWNKPTMVVYVRPQRYTKGFMDDNECFTVSILPTEYKEALTYLGKTSGRDEDKVSKVGITPIYAQDTTYFEEAKMVFICRKLYRDTLKEDHFLDQAVSNAVYPEKDFHDVYVGEIVDILVKEEKR